MQRTTRTLLVATLALAAGASFAQSSRNVPPSWANEQAQPFTSVLSRAEVMADISAARHDGRLDAFDADAAFVASDPAYIASTYAATTSDYPYNRVAVNTTTPLTRAEVTAELNTARSVAANYRTHSDINYMTDDAQVYGYAPLPSSSSVAMR